MDPPPVVFRRQETHPKRMARPNFRSSLWQREEICSYGENKKREKSRWNEGGCLQGNDDWKSWNSWDVTKKPRI